MKRPDSETLRRRYGFLGAENIEKQLKKVEEELSWIWTERKKWSVGLDLSLRDGLRDSERSCQTRIKRQTHGGLKIEQCLNFR